MVRMTYTATHPAHGLCPGSRIISVTRHNTPSPSATTSPIVSADPLDFPMQTHVPWHGTIRYTVSEMVNRRRVELLMGRMMKPQITRKGRSAQDCTATHE